MQLAVHMKLESDAIFGNGMSVPGGEDISVQTDVQGFPFLKGSTFKGIFREELINYLAWEKKTGEEAEAIVERLMGVSGSHDLESPGKMIVSDLCLHPDLIKQIQEEEELSPREITEMFTYLRTFTSLEGGLAKEGSLRSARCIKKGLNFYGICVCQEEDAAMIKDVLGLIKWVGTMRSRGFGKVNVTGEEVLL